LNPILTTEFCLYIFFQKLIKFVNKENSIEAFEFNRFFNYFAQIRVEFWQNFCSFCLS